MALEVRIEKKQVFAFAGLCLLIAGLFIATAYGTTNPPVLGHTPGEISPGTFGGDAASTYLFPGKVGIGPNNDPLSRDLFVSDYYSTAGIGISSAVGEGDVYIDFVKGGLIKSSLSYSEHPGAPNALFINNNPQAVATPVIIGNLSGSGNAYACVNFLGKLYRSSTPCVP